MTKGAVVQGCKGARVPGALVPGALVPGALVPGAPVPGAPVAGVLVPAALVLGAILLWGSIASAQHEGHQPPAARPSAPAAPPAARPPDKVNGVEPIRCWRQLSAGAVSIGETFTLTLTCAVYDADNAQVVPDESRLDVASIQLTPFEILGGSHPADVRRGFRRFLQYDYQLRIIGPDAIGRDLNIPPLTLTYRIHSRVGGSAALEGRDLEYLLPMLPIKVLSLVPADAADIRDTSEANLGAVESLRFRASLFRVLTYVFGALAAAMVMLALVPLTRSKTTVATEARDEVSDRAVLRAAIGELTQLQSRVAAGWSDDEIARALSVMRIIAAVAIGAGLSRKPAGSVSAEGRIGIDEGVVRKRRSVVASAVTSDDVARAAVAPAWSATRRQALEDFASMLRTFTSTLYARQSTPDTGALDDGVRQAMSLARDVWSERPWLRTRWARR